MARSGKSEVRKSALRSLPSVDQLLQRVLGDAVLAQIPRARIVQAIREVLAGERGRLLDGLKRAGTVADRKSTRLNSSHIQKSRMPSSA